MSKVSKVLTFFCASVMMFLPSIKGYALEELIYTHNFSPSVRALLYRFVNSADNISREHIQLASTDLNEDGLPEHILKDTRCTEINGFCHFWIVADDDDTFLILGEFRARRLAIGQKTSEGIHDVIAFQTPVNDYKYTVYSWDPLRSQYRVKQ